MGWADDEKHVMYYRKNPAYKRRRAIKGIFSGQDMFNVLGSAGEVIDEAETFWRDIESDCGEPLGLIRETQAISDDEQRIAVAKTAALNWARGRSIQERSRHLAANVVDHRYYGFLDRIDELTEVFRADFDRDPRPGEIEYLVDQMFSVYRDSNKVAVDSMLNSYDKFVSWASGMYVELLVGPAVGRGMATSDSPLVHVNRTTGQVGHVDGLALGDADLVLMPLSRRLACTFTTHPSEAVSLTNNWIERLNKECIWPGAQEHVVTHPNEHPSGVVPNYSDWAADLGKPPSN